VGAQTATTIAVATPNSADAAAAVSMCAGATTRRWISAGPTPRLEKTSDSHTATPAPATTPNSAGVSRRASTTSTPILRTARAPLPADIQKTPPRTLRLRLEST
jgi:hypothetical protein